MDDLVFAENFTQPIVDDAVLRDSRLDEVLFSELGIERNCYDLCAWPKCSKNIKRFSKIPNKPIFCCESCKHKFETFFENKEEIEVIPLGSVIEKFEQMKPPKKKTFFESESMDGLRVRVGPYRKQLTLLEKWVKEGKKSKNSKLNEAQTILFNLVDEQIHSIGASLNNNSQTQHFFASLKVDDASDFEISDNVFKSVFSLAMFEIMTGTDMSKEVLKTSFNITTYDDLLQILNGIPEIY